MQFKKCAYLFSLLLWLGSCSNSEEVKINISPDEREYINKQYEKLVTEYRPTWDSIKEHTFDSLVQIATDSIIKERKEDARKLKERTLKRSQNEK